VELLNAGYDVTVFDNFSNSLPESLNRVERITGKQVDLIHGDVREGATLASALKTSGAEAVVHFAGLKAIGESVERPLIYYENNIMGALNLLKAMQISDVKTLVFSSSATVYGQPEQLPIPEGHPLSTTNPYGRTKLVIEEMLRDLHQSDPTWRLALLRYFNPVGAHSSSLIGEDPRGVPNNLLPCIAQVAAGRRECLKVWGSDYPTPDGTGVRDYIHVVDLALGHIKALDHLQGCRPGCWTLNLGTGIGHTVLEMVRTFEQVSGRPVPYTMGPRRPGDIAACYADPSLALRTLGWRAERGIESMCTDAWRWQNANPYGYGLPPA
jgi:UDP-glucose 4-epimerase